jgi:fatty acid desaturase
VTPPPKSERDFLRLLQWASAGCLGLTAAFIESLKSVNPVVRFEFSLGTVLMFAAVTGAAWYVMERVFFRALLAGRQPPVKLVIAFTALLTVGTLAGFATLWAVMALSVVGYAFWRVVRFLEREARETEEKERAERRE